MYEDVERNILELVRVRTMDAFSHLLEPIVLFDRDETSPWVGRYFYQI